MKFSYWGCLVTGVLGVFAWFGADVAHGEDGWRATGLHGAVVAGGPGRQAVDAGLEVLRGGGNAADAACATLLVLSVIDPGNFCLGGETPIMVYDARGEVVEVIAGQGAAPRLATFEHFQRIGGIPQKGIQAAAVPGAFDAILTTLDRHGTITFRRAAQPMLAALDAKPDQANQQLAATIRELTGVEQQATDRRRGLRLVADYFYRGPIARRIDAWSKANDGLIRYEDLATHVTRLEEPVRATYRGYDVVKCGAWTQGPCLLQTLALLEGFDVKPLGPTSPEFVHLAVESLKLALADRDTYYGDPLFSAIPLDTLLSPEYSQRRRALIDRDKASRDYRPGDVAPTTNKVSLATTPAAAAGPQRDTTTCLVADQHGNVVAATPSGWGGVLAGDTGILLGSRLRSLSMTPGYPNCVAPGKRPRITLTPTLVLKHGKPVLAVSVAGGDLQDQVSLQMVTSCLDFGKSPADAVTLPRFSTSHHVGSFNQPPPKLGQLSVNEAYGAETLERLRKLGHDVELAKPPIGHPVVIRIDPATGRKEAAGDPAARREAAAY